MDYYIYASAAKSGLVVVSVYASMAAFPSLIKQHAHRHEIADNRPTLLPLSQVKARKAGQDAGPTRILKMPRGAQNPAFTE
jgi:hypothetical protein